MIDFNESPFIVIWELTRACALRCLHCRAEAQYYRHPEELTTEEGKGLIDQIAKMDQPILVFTGGDPLMRPDLYEFIEYAVQKGLRVSMTPSATPKVTKKAMEKAKEAGLSRWAFSLDGPTEDIHDFFRGTKGSYQRTIKAIQYLHELDLPVQINTVVSRFNVSVLEEMAERVEELGAVLWSVFFLIPTGRASNLVPISPEDHEKVLHWLAELKDRVPYDIKTTEAPFYRRVIDQGGRKDKDIRPKLARDDVRPFIDGIGRAPFAVNDGKGFVFISHTGEVYPSGFLPLKCGNIRETDLLTIYRNHPVFKELRDPNLLKGKCGMCEYRFVCGGSRSRAYAVTGDYLASDPFCIYKPTKLKIVR
jgi:AdoMet-dependent heme synthase